MTPTLAAGHLRQRVAVQTKTEERDASGGVVEAWVTEGQRWACVEPLRGKELFEAQAVDARLTVKVGMRYYAGLSPTQRFLYGTRVLNIVSVVNVAERSIQTIAMCTEDV